VDLEKSAVGVGFKRNFGRELRRGVKKASMTAVIAIRIVRVLVEIEKVVVLGIRLLSVIQIPRIC